MFCKNCGNQIADGTAFSVKKLVFLQKTVLFFAEMC